MIGHFWLGNALGRAWHWIDDRVFGLRGTRQITAMRDGCNYYTNYICVCIGVCVCVLFTQPTRGRLNIIIMLVIIK